MKIVIPTYRRVDRQQTLETLHPELRKDAVLVVRQDEYQDLMKHQRDGVFVHILDDDIDTLGKTRQFIWEEYGDERFVMIDDDIRGFLGLDYQGMWVPLETENDQRAMLEDLEACLDAGAGAAGPRGRWSPPRKGGQIVSAGDLAGFYMLDGPRLRGLDLRWDRVEYIEDWDFMLQVLSHGIDTVLHQRYTYNTDKTGGGQGGQNAGIGWGERMRRGREAGRRLTELWPGTVMPSTRMAGFTVQRSRLLADARKRLNMADITIGCAGCDRPIPEGERTVDGVCLRCQQMLEGAEGSPDVLESLARWLRASQSLGAPDATGGDRSRTRRGRGRPPAGRNHPVIRTMAGKGPFTVDRVSEIYASRGSASVALANLAKKGLLRRVGLGLYEVVPEEKVQEPKESVYKDPYTGETLSSTPALDPTLMSGGQ